MKFVIYLDSNLNVVKNFLTVISCWLFVFQLSGQDVISAIPGRVNKEDFNAEKYNVDQQAGAIVLFDKGYTEFTVNSADVFEQKVFRHKRILILKNSGFKAATEKIYLINDGDYNEKLLNFEATTFYLSDGNVISQKLDKSHIQKARHNRFLTSIAFAFPNVKEGVIIEFTYTYTTMLSGQFMPWHFQDDYPVVWSEYGVKVPSFIVFSYTLKGNRKCDIDTLRQVVTRYFSKGRAYFDVKDTSTERRWVMKNLPAFREEPFIASKENLLSSLSFQALEAKEPLRPRYLTPSWEEVNKEFLLHPYLGFPLSHTPVYIKTLLAELGIDSMHEHQKPKKIFEYVRDNIESYSSDDILINSSLEDVVKNKKGSKSEANLLLILMLRNAGFDAKPLLISTRQNGRLSKVYPIMREYNHVLCYLSVNNVKYTLDASEKFLGFGKYYDEHWNDFGLLIGDELNKLAMSPDSVRQKETVLCRIKAMDDSRWETYIEYKTSDAQAFALRRKTELRQEALVHEIAEILGMDAADDISVDSIMAFDQPLLIRTHSAEEMGDSFVYILPFKHGILRENPFKDKDRNFPVEFACLQEYQMVTFIEIPANYRLESLPESKIFQLDEEKSLVFEIKFTADNNKITARSKIKFNRAFFEADEYQALRETYDYIVQRHNASMVLRKE